MARKINFKKEIKFYTESTSDTENRCNKIEDLYGITWAIHLPSNEMTRDFTVEYLSSFYTSGLIYRGALRIPEKEGWESFRRAIRYITLSNMVKVHQNIESQSENPDKMELEPKAPIALFGNLLLKEWELAKWNALHLEGYGSKYYRMPSDAFGCCLEALASNDSKRLEAICQTRGLGAYKDIILYWNDIPKLKKAMEKALNYHEKLTRGDGIFSNDFQDVWPLEFSAMLQVRNKLGLETPEVEHQYTDSPYWNMILTEDLSPFSDLLWDQVFKVSLPKDFIETTLEQADRDAPRSTPSQGKKASTKSNADLEQFDQWIFDGDFDQASEHEETLFVDWRGDPDEIVSYFEKQLPEDELVETEVPRNDDKTSITMFGRTRKLDLVDDDGPVALLFLGKMAKLARPEYDTRVFKETLGWDGAIVVTREKAWWDKMEKTNKKAVQKMFKKW